MSRGSVAGGDRKLTTVELTFTAVLSALVGAAFLFWSNVVWDLAQLTLGLLYTPVIYGMWFIGARAAFLPPRYALKLLEELGPEEAVSEYSARLGCLHESLGA